MRKAVVQNIANTDTILRKQDFICKMWKETKKPRWKNEIMNKHNPLQF